MSRPCDRQHWVMCPTCGGKTRTRIRGDTVLENFPLYCPKCKHETVVTLLREPPTSI